MAEVDTSLFKEQHFNKFIGGSSIGWTYYFFGFILFFSPLKRTCFTPKTMYSNCIAGNFLMHGLYNYYARRRFFHVINPWYLICQKKILCNQSLLPPIK